MINLEFLLLKAFAENLVEGDTKKSIKNYLKNLDKYRLYLKNKEKEQSKEQ